MDMEKISESRYARLTDFLHQNPIAMPTTTGSHALGEANTSPIPVLFTATSTRPPFLFHIESGHEDVEAALDHLAKTVQFKVPAEYEQLVWTFLKMRVHIGLSSRMGDTFISDYKTLILIQYFGVPVQVVGDS